MNIVKLGMVVQVLLGIRASSSLRRASQKKKAGKSTKDSKNGTRKPAVLNPYEAPRVKPRMRRMIAESIMKEPTRSSRFHLVSAMSASSPCILGTM